jgi:uncharacterized ion transporter superfamily protein YfcC
MDTAATPANVARERNPAMSMVQELLRPAPTDSGAPAAHRRSLIPHPIIMMILIIAAAALLTWIIPSGLFDRAPNGHVLAGTYHEIPKQLSADALLLPHRSTPRLAYPAPLVALALSIPAGMTAAAGLIFMIMFLGGMFGVLRASGALDAGMERLLSATGGNVYLLAPALMIALSAGSTFLGLISEYLVLIPMMLVLAEKLKLGPLFAVALVAIPAKLGYLASVTNPLPLVIAQPIVGVPVFSGAGFRLVMWVVFLALGMAYLLVNVWRSGFSPRADAGFAAPKLTPRQVAVLAVLGLGILAIVYGADALDWRNPELAAFYVGLAAVIAVLGGVRAEPAAEAFVDGMKSMMLAALLVGLAGAVEVVLRESLVLDTIINDLASLARDRAPVMVAEALVAIEIILDVLIPSTSAKAAISMPILWPIAQLTGVSGQTTVLAYLVGNGLTNMVTPTSGMLLAYLGTGRVPYGTWMRFILPLWCVLLALSLLAAAIAVWIGY